MTAQHPPVPPRPPADEPAAGEPAPGDRGAANPTQAVPAASGPAAAPDDVRPDDDRPDEDDSPAEEAHEDGRDGNGTENPDDHTRAIDATLARFSAVHDQIAEEEAQRRKRFGWLLGKRKEPELGQDMPFDFVEGGRDGESSRLEWKKQQRQQRTVRMVKALTVTAAIMVFVATGIGWSAKAWVDAKFREVSALDPNSTAIRNADMQSGDVNFLLIGSDTRAGADAGDNIGTAADHPGARSDTTMIAHIPADRSRVLVVSFPRDLEVDLPSCRRWDPKSGSYTGKRLEPKNNVKFNVAYAIGGPKCTTKVVQRISGLSVTNFLGINFQGFQAMVDAVGGVRICSKTPIVDSVLGPVLPEAGQYKLDGARALKYVRARHVEGDRTADYGRMERQQLFLSALLRKAMSAQVLLDPGKLTGFANAVTSNTFGENIGTDQLIGLGRSLQGLDPGAVTFITVPTTGEANENGNEELRESDADALFRAIIEGTPLAPSEEEGSGNSRADTRQVASTRPVGTDGSATVTPMAASVQAAPARNGPVRTAPAQAGGTDVPIKVFNATDRSGLAGRTSDKLSEVGYTVDGVGNIDESVRRTVIRHSAANVEAARVLATSVPGAETVEDPSAGDVLRLELGTGYEGTVTAPATGKPDVPDNLATVNAGRDVCG